MPLMLISRFQKIILNPQTFKSRLISRFQKKLFLSLDIFLDVSNPDATILIPGSITDFNSYHASGERFKIKKIQPFFCVESHHSTAIEIIWNNMPYIASSMNLIIIWTFKQVIHFFFFHICFMKICTYFIVFNLVVFVGTLYTVGTMIKN